MRFVLGWRFASIAILIFTISIGVVWSASDEQTVPTEPHARATWFLQHVKNLADSGRLDDPDFVGRIVGTKFTREQDKRSINPENCAIGLSGIPSIVVMRMSPSSGAWYRSQPDGTKQFVPGAFINPSYTTGISGFSYSVEDTSWCNPPPFQENHEHEATINFQNIPDFVCIDETELKADLPTVGQQIATDGFNPYEYTGRTDDRTGTDVEFSYRFGAGCLLDVTIKQSDRHGYKYQRAWTKLSLCQIEKLRAMCAQDNGEASGIGDANARMDRADNQCQTLQWLIDHEPNSNEPPEALDFLAVPDAEMCRPHKKM